ncbi:hypothetical protein CR513_15417, partial [Mucuna pruriens]
MRTEASRPEKANSAILTLSSSSQMPISHADSCRADSVFDSNSDADSSLDANSILDVNSRPDTDSKAHTNSHPFGFISAFEDRLHFTTTGGHHRKLRPSFSPKSTACIDNLLYELEPMQNNNRLKKLAMLDLWCIQYPQLESTQSYELKSRLIHLLPMFHDLAGEGVPYGLFHDEVAWDPERLYKNEGISIFSQWSNKGLDVSTTGHVQHMGRHEANVPRKVLTGIQDCDHLEGDIWNLATLWGDTAQILGEVQQVVCHVSTPSN